MRCYKCGKDYDSDAMTCPFCGQRNFVDRIPGTEEESKGEDLFVAWKTRSIPMFLNIADRFVRKVLHVEKIIICVLLLVTVFILVVAPAFGAAVRFIRKDSVLGELSTLYEQEQFTLLVDRMRNGGYMGKEGFEQYTEMVLLYENYLDFCSARMSYQEDIADGELENWTINDLTNSMRDMFSDLHLSNKTIPDYPGNDAYRECCRNDVLVFAQAVLKLTDEELARLEMINCFDIEDVLKKAIGEMRK
jgi:hypothetical protein